MSACTAELIFGLDYRPFGRTKTVLYLIYMHGPHYSNVKWRHGLSIHIQLDCLFNSKKVPKVSTTVHLWGETTSDRWIPLILSQQCRKHCYDVIMSIRQFSMELTDFPSAIEVVLKG